MDESAGTVQVCMHLGGVGLVDNVTLSTLDGSARGEFNVVTYFFGILILLIWIVVAVGRDYSRTVQAFTISSGERRCITIRILNDTIIESAVEYFQVRLQSTRYLQPYYRQLRHATVYIRDNDGMHSGS